MKPMHIAMKPFSVVAVLLLGLAAVAAPSGAAAAEKPGGAALQKVNVAYSSISGNNAPLWVTVEKGFFRKYGLDVQPILIESGTTAAQSLISGEISFAHMAGAAVMQANLRGADTVMIAGVVNTLIFQLYTDKTISRPDQLKGKTVGVTRFGSSTDFAMRYALEKYGLEPNKDVTILQLGNVPALLSALEGGKLNAAMLSPPTTLRAKKAGFPMLADLQMLGLEYQHTGIATTRSLIKSKPELVRDFMRAYVEGIHYAKTHRRETIEILTKYLRTDDKDVLDETYESIMLTLVPEKPYPTLKGLQIMLRELGTKDPAARAARPEQFVDLTFVKELDTSGFVDRLYKTQAVARAPRSEPSAPPAASPPPAPPATASTKAPTEAKPTPPLEAKAPARSPAEKAEVTPATVKTAPASSGSELYIVKPGDTLSRIAQRFYNSVYKWEKIYEANRDVVKNPHYIYVGQKLLIPPDDQAG
ncbi:MAG TPA: ABC transporter substrate-binding protein [Candidatus Eisenbacteria bacterium]|nr:ABC transporter substrate-binding protein [Candidatus Eisenbacteria bacterium]